MWLDCWTSWILIKRIISEIVLYRAGVDLSFIGSSLSAHPLIFLWWIGMLCPWQEELVPEFMLFQKILWRWNRRWSWPCLPAWWAEEWSEYKRVDPCKGKKNNKNRNATKTQPATLGACVADQLWPRWNAVGLGTIEVQRTLFCFARQTLIKILRERSFNQQTCSFPKGKFNLPSAHRNAFITDLHLAILLWSCFSLHYFSDTWCVFFLPLRAIRWLVWVVMEKKIM